MLARPQVHQGVLTILSGGFDRDQDQDGESSKPGKARLQALEPALSELRVPQTENLRHWTRPLLLAYTCVYATIRHALMKVGTHATQSKNLHE